MMEYSSLKKIIKGAVTENAPMKKYTTWNIGGPADCLVEPEDAEDISAVFRWTAENGVPLTVIGNGSNLLVLDGGIEGVVVRIGDRMSGFSFDDTLLVAQSGCILSKMARETARRGLAGIHWAAGIPASLGGAAYMNAGAYGHTFYETLDSVEAVDKDGTIRVFHRENLSGGYRHTSVMENGLVVTKVMIRLEHGNAEDLVSSVEDTLRLRREKQPLDKPSAGSVFKNPEGSHAGYLVELTGLRGRSCGGAEVSLKHGNFILNTGNATAKDVLTLMDICREEVKKQQGYDLEPEVRIIGRP